MSRKEIKRTALAERAMAWRQRVGMTPEQLAEMTGYSREAVYQYERGYRADGAKLSDYAWQRYMMACAAVDAQMKGGRKFAW